MTQYDFTKGMKTLLSAITRREVTSTSKAQGLLHMSRSRKWRSKESAVNRQQARAASTTANMDGKADYSSWSQESLIKRVTQLERELKEKTRRSIAFSILLKDSFADKFKTVSPPNPLNPRPRKSTRSHV